MSISVNDLKSYDTLKYYNYLKNLSYKFIDNKITTLYIFNSI